MPAFNGHLSLLGNHDNILGIHGTTSSSDKLSATNFIKIETLKIELVNRLARLAPVEGDGPPQNRCFAFTGLPVINTSDIYTF